MNAKTLIVSIALLSSAFTALHAGAAPAPGEAIVAQATPTTRETVTAELLRARAAGETCTSEADCGRLPAMAPAALRQQAAQQGSGVHICQNEAECDAAPHRDFTITREQVMAEFYRARAAGEIPETEADNDIGRAALRHRAP
jgi:hypothetical protein